MGASGSKGPTQKQMIDLQVRLTMVTKKLNTEARKREKERDKAKLEVAKCLKKGDRAGAQTYAETAIDKDNQRLKFLRLGQRYDRVKDKVKEQQTMASLTKDIGKVTKVMAQVQASMDTEATMEVMAQFEEQCMDLEVMSKVQNEAMEVTTAPPQEQVAQFLQQIAAEHSIEMSAESSVPQNELERRQYEAVKKSMEACQGPTV